MGGSTKKVMGSGLLTGLAIAAAPFTAGASLGITLGAGAAGALAGGVAAKGEYDSTKAMQRAQEEANKLTIAQAKRDAGMAPTSTNQGDTITDTLRKKSAIRRSILTGTTKTAQKLGD